MLKSHLKLEPESGAVLAVSLRTPSAYTSISGRISGRSISLGRREGGCSARAIHFAV